MGKRIACITLGCKVNQYETEAITEQFERLGYEVVPFESTADVYLINTCTVTHIGDKKSRQMIRRAHRRNPAALVVATGCYAQVAPDEVAGIEGVDLVIGTRGRERLAELVDKELERGTPHNAVVDIEQAVAFEELPVSKTQGRARAYIKVQEGCRDFCTYCIVPYTRGPLRSRPPGAVLDEARRLVANGYVELVLTGTHLGAYGRDLADRPSLAELVLNLTRVPGIVRLRLSSIEPLDISPALIRVLADSSVACPHLHIPVQSGSSFTLRRMGRRYTTREFGLLVSHLRSEIPGIGLTTDVMVGFPGETDEHFRESMAFVSRMAFSGLHVFKYSPRRGTRAATFPEQVPAPVKEVRSNEMLALGARLKQEFAEQHVGKTVEVLVEERAGDSFEGYTGDYLRARFPAGASDIIGEIARVKVNRAVQGLLIGNNSQ